MKYDIEKLVDAINKVKSDSGCDDVEVYSWCELPSQIKELFNLLEVEHIIIPDKYYSKDFDKDVLYISPIGGVFTNED